MNCQLCNLNFELIENTILYESKHFYVLPAVGPIYVGHCIIVSKIHSESFASLPHFQEHLDDVFKIYAHSQKVYKTDNVLLSEHGSYKDQKGGNCIIHAHIHILPGMIKYIDVLQDVLPLNPIKKLEAIEGINYPYIFNYANEQLRVYTAYNAHSQMMRKAICSRRQNLIADWKSDKNIKAIEETINLWINEQNTPS